MGHEKCFKDENRIKEVKGIYVTFWLYDCEADAEIRCRATRLRHWETSSYSYTETQHYLVSRGGKIGFERISKGGVASAAPPFAIYYSRIGCSWIPFNAASNASGMREKSATMLVGLPSGSSCPKGTK